MQKIVITKSGNYTFTLDKEGSELEIVGHFWLKNKEVLNLSVVVIHAAKNTRADTKLKAVVDDGALANLNGSIIVKKGAQLTNSFLKENVLLLGPNAKATAIPNLEIESNDVKCSHAATIGTVDQNQLFYLQSRGLDPQTAKNLIAKGFLEA